MKKTIFTLFFVPVFSYAADTQVFRGEATTAYETKNSNGKYVASPEDQQSLCQLAQDNALAQKEYFIANLQSSFGKKVDSSYVFSRCGTIAVTGIPSSKPIADTANIKITITYTVTDEDINATSSQQKECLSRPAIDGVFNNVYSDKDNRYINYNNCQYEAGGVVVCRSDGSTCTASWVSTGQLTNNSYPSSSVISDNSSTDEPSEPSGSILTRSDVKSAVSESLKENNVLQSDAIASQLTEKGDMTKFTADSDKQSQTYVTSIGTSLDNLVRGAARYADPNRAAQYGTEYSELDHATDLADSLYGVDKNSHGSTWETFLSQGALLPTLPNGNGCSDFIMFSGEIYQIKIDCNKLMVIKQTLSWVFYSLTFWYVFTSFTSLLRKGE
ncbi:MULTISPECIES: attachment protein [Pectobacterium]|uniref:attachment protein n=1 Tax=Pectobacterium TaxID=122277 RepID=UPI00188778EC|nr:attachment protein [Pectobacterium carotovorum]MBG0750761.1 Attachment protein G3P [Pectobacterium carotovorum subsp. carotovorum PCCS1]